MLDKAVVRAREDAEQAAYAALRVLAVDQPDAFATLTEEQRDLRNRLRAKVRQLGKDSDDGFHSLAEEVAYVQWHRMLFARFLIENGLLIHPSGAAVTFDECAELAESEGEPDGWTLAARYASGMLPGIFRQGDPSAEVRFAPESRTALETILAQLPPLIFTSDDALGWVYQFWQSKRKKEVSASGRKIERLDLAAYSELFTEHYIVRFLLENSLGAWWATRHPASPLLGQFDYLRHLEDGAPAAGSFPGWPERAADVTVMDPCCGSGHFLVSAFDMLHQMRMEEEGLSAPAAAEAVLRDNLFGLELDPRCVQIAAFNLALTAWKNGGYRPLPAFNVACSGLPVTGQLTEWTKLASSDANLRHSIEQLYQLFVNAPDLGSLINPSDVPLRERMFAPDFAAVRPLLERALEKERTSDPVSAVFGEAAAATARAASLLAREYTLVATNVPYLTRGKQGEPLKEFLDLRHADAKADLATAFVERCRAFVKSGGSYALVTPQNWLFLGSYKRLREKVLKEQSWNLVVRLGEGAFESPAAAGAFVALSLLTNAHASASQELAGIDASAQRSPQQKDEALRSAPLQLAEQSSQLRNPDARLSLDASFGTTLLSAYAHGVHGLGTKDAPRFVRCFWEQIMSPKWEFMQTTVSEPQAWGGMEHAVFWEQGHGILHELGKTGWAILAGGMAWGKPGVCVSQMRALPATLYTGQIFDKNVAVVLPKNPAHLPAIWAFCSSPDFATAVRRIDQKVNVTNATLVKVPFDLDRWQRLAEDLYPNGLPEPNSNDATQWLFKGNPADSIDPLLAAVARLLGYRWPQQEPDRLDRFADVDGIAPLVAVAGKEPAEPRLREVLASAYGKEWSPAKLDELLARAGFGTKGLGAWLREAFFEQHCKLFHQRPFIWQIWDGLRDGFSVLVNYHHLDSGLLDRLIYTLLGDWIRIQRNARDANAPGADARLVAALQLQEKLKHIQAGEPPYDIYVRWKPFHEQPIGWDPDLDDGVRLNIRPFVQAGVLRSRVNVNWNKDRGNNPDGSERINAKHLTLLEKNAARKAAL